MKTIFTLGAILLFFPVAFSNANDIDRYLESTTVAVVQLDLARVDLPATAKFVQTNFPGMFNAQTINGIQLAAGGIVQSLRGAGVTKVYATLSTLEITRGHLALIIPCTKPEAVRVPLDSILAMVPESLGYKIHVNNDSIIVATDSVWQRFSKTPKAERNDLSNALDQVASSSVGIVINVREELRSEMVDAFPERLPTGWPVAFSPKALMEDVVTLQIAIQTPPGVQATLSANCRDPKATTRVSALANEAIEKLGLVSLKCTATDKQARVSSGGDEFIAMIRDITKSGRSSAAEMQQGNNLKQVGIAVHNFYSAYDGLPPRMTVSEKKTPLLSWRVFLLPFLAQQALYNEFHLDEPWDSPHNLKLVDRIPPCYQSLQFPDLQLGRTLVQAPLIPGSAWDGNTNQVMTFQDITDGTSETICFVVAPKSKAVAWTKPDDLTLGVDTLVTDLFGDRDFIEVAFFDSSVRRLERKIDVNSLKVYLTHAGGEAKVPR